MRLRGDLAAFLRSSDDDGGSSGKVGLRRVGNGCSVDLMGSLDAGYPSGQPHLPFRVKRLSSVLMDDLKVAHKYGGDDGA